MRSEHRFLLYSGTFGLVTAVTYWIVAREEAGTTMLALMGSAAGFVGVYLLAKARGIRRSEDDPDASHGEHEGEVVGEFSSGSVWPPVMGLGATLAAVGFVYGVWLLFLGFVLFGWSVIGLMMESRG